MSAVPFTLVLALAWFAATNLALSLVAWALARRVGAALIVDRPRRAARRLFALRVLPAAVSIIFTLGVFLPAHWRWEPARAHETAGYSIALFAILGSAIVAIAIFNATRETLGTAALVRRWRAIGRYQISVNGLPVVAVADSTPVVSLVGVVRPVVYIADDLRAGLTAEEFEVSVAHERAHLRSQDNLKRLVAVWCPDMLFGVLGRGLASSWRAASEFAADAEAARASEQRAVALASALVKVARLTPAHSLPQAAGVSRIHHQALLAARVERLLHQTTAEPRARRSSSSAAALFAAIVTMAWASFHFWLAIHLATESLVRVLP